MKPSPDPAEPPLDDRGGSEAGSAHLPQADLRGGLAWMGFGALVLAASWRMDRFETMGGTLYTAPGLVPGLFGALLCLLGGVLALRSWRRRVRPAPGDAPESAKEIGPGPLLNRRIVGTLLLCLVYAAGLIGRVPFSVATVAFVTLFTALYAQTPSVPRRWGLALLTGVLTALLVVGVFEQVFLVRLP